MAELMPCGAGLDQMSNSWGRALPHERERAWKNNVLLLPQNVWVFFLI